MSRFHDRTLELLGRQVGGARGPIVCGLPAACREWLEIDPSCALLEELSNTDSFFLHAPREIVLPDGTRAALFNTESQGNFSRAVLLDGTDDPPVVFAWLGRPPWVLHAPRFSECVYAQVFDWQYMVDEMSFYATLSLGTDRVLATLAARFTETVETRYVIEGAPFVERRFLRESDERITAICGRNPDRRDVAVALQIAGPKDRVLALHAELISLVDEPILDRWPPA